MPTLRSVCHKLLCLSLSLQLAAPILPARAAQSTEQLKITCDNPSNLSSAQPDYVQTLSDTLRQMGARGVKCTSCYRDSDRQRRACERICGNPNGCPGLCAPPGRSQHQRQNIAVCDLQGMPDGTCWTLKKLCDDRYGGKCGIGGYRGGGYHFGVGDYRFSAWNRCAGLPRGPSGSRPTGGNDPGGSSGGGGSRTYTYSPPDRPDPSPGSKEGSEIEAQELITAHEAIIVAAVAAAGVGGALLYQKWRKKK